jgi:predicted HD superfamily hydrolase involved in NAD metabolism
VGSETHQITKSKMDQPLITRYTPFLEQQLTPRRLQHSLGVMRVMGELAPIYSLDPETALVTGLLHDAAKDLPPEQVQQIVGEAGIQTGEPCEQNYELYLHGPVGAYFIYKELGISDEIILDAIRLHTYYGKIGPTFNSPMAWCLRFSDILEPGRNWVDAPPMREGAPRLRELVYSGHLIEGAYVHLDMVIKMFEEKGMPVHSNMRRIRHEFSLQLDKEHS